MAAIEVMVTSTHVDGQVITYWGDEVGTYEFYTVMDTIEAYLGKNIWITYNDGTFLIEDEDEGCDNSYDYMEILENIYENAYSYEGRRHLSFVII